MTGAQVLQVARLRAGLTQAELSVLAGRTQAQLSLWESGRRAVPLATLGELVAACGLDLTLELATGDRSLHELAELQQRLAPHERLARLIAPGHAQRALCTLGALDGLGQDAVLIGGLARVLRGGPAVPAPLAQVAFADPDSAREVLWEAGWTPGEIHDDFAGLHARERFEAPTPGGWPIELIENPAGVPDHRPLRLDAALLPGLPAVLVASVRAYAICGGSPEPPHGTSRTGRAWPSCAPCSNSTSSPPRRWLLRERPRGSLPAAARAAARPRVAAVIASRLSCGHGC